MTDDLLAFLHQQFENQRFRGESLKTLAYALPPETGAYLTETGDLLLADVDAKRRILDWHSTHKDGPFAGIHCEQCEDTAPCMTVRLLALPHADHPDYREEWKP